MSATHAVATVGDDLGMRRRGGDYDTDAIVLRTAPDLLAEVERLRAFVAVHSGKAHVLRIRVRRGAQTLYCSCGLPSVATREEDEPEFS